MKQNMKRFGNAGATFRKRPLCEEQSVNERRTNVELALGDGRGRSTPMTNTEQRIQALIEMLNRAIRMIDAKHLLADTRRIGAHLEHRNSHRRFRQLQQTKIADAKHAGFF
jgi:hypothetical protein